MRPDVEADPREGPGPDPEPDAGAAPGLESPDGAGEEGVAAVGAALSAPDVGTPAEGPRPAVPPPAAPPARSAPPSVGRLVGGSLELLVASSADLRRLSLALGLFAVAFVALPFGAVLAYGLRAASATLFEAAGAERADGFGPAAMLVAIASAFIAFVVLSVEVQILVAATVGGRVAGAPLGLREALKRTRQVFWRVVRGSILVGLIVAIPNVFVQVLVTELVGNQTQLALAVQILTQTLISAPFVYVLPGIVLGGVGAADAIRRSAWLAGLRWRLAFMIALLPTLGQLLLIVALFAGLGVVATAIDVGGGGPDVSGGLDPLVALAIYLFVAAAVASLFIAVVSVQVAPQVAGFHAMTGYADGLDEARGGRPEPLLHRPALVVYGAGLLATVFLGLSAIAPASVATEAARRIAAYVGGGVTFDVPYGWEPGDSGPSRAYFINPPQTVIVELIVDPGSPGAALEALRRDVGADHLTPSTSERVTIGGATADEARFELRWDDQIGLLRGVIESGTVHRRQAAVLVLYDPSLGSQILDLDALVGDGAIRFAREIWASGR